jgi:hypothetical protein
LNGHNLVVIFCGLGRPPDDQLAIISAVSGRSMTFLAMPQRDHQIVNRG